MDAGGDDDRVRVVSKRACPHDRVHGQGLRGAGPMAPGTGPVSRCPGSGHRDRAILGGLALRAVPATNQCTGGIEDVVESDGRMFRDGTFSALEASEM